MEQTSKKAISSILNIHHNCFMFDSFSLFFLFRISISVCDSGTETQKPQSSFPPLHWWAPQLGKISPLQWLWTFRFVALKNLLKQDRIDVRWKDPKMSKFIPCYTLTQFLTAGGCLCAHWYMWGTSVNMKPDLFFFVFFSLLTSSLHHSHSFIFSSLSFLHVVTSHHCTNSSWCDTFIEDTFCHFQRKQSHESGFGIFVFRRHHFQSQVRGMVRQQWR